MGEKFILLDKMGLDKMAMTPWRLSLLVMPRGDLSIVLYR